MTGPPTLFDTVPPAIVLSWECRCGLRVAAPLALETAFEKAVHDHREWHEPLADPSADTIGAFHAPRSEAPDTERLAALAVYPTGPMRLRVLECFRDAHPEALTDRDVAARTGIYLYTAAPRRQELVLGGWLEDSGDRGVSDHGRPMAKWRLTQKAIAHLGLAVEAAS